LKNGTVSYNVFDHKTTTSSGGLGVFEPDNIFIYSLNAEANLKSIDLKNLDVALKSLSFNEKSGFSLENLKFALTSKDKILNVNDLALTLPNSEILVKTGELNYTGLNINEITAGATYSLNISSSIYPPDLSAFTPQFADLDEQLSLSGEITGKMPAIAIPAFKAAYGDRYSLVANIYSSDITSWDKANYDITFGDLMIAETKNPHKFDKINAEGRIAGTVSDFSFKISETGKQGNLELDGKGGYSPTSGDYNFEAEILANDLNIRSLLADTTFGSASFKATAIAKSAKNKVDSTNVEIEISRLDYRGYSYSNITAKADYIGDKIGFDLKSDDENALLSLNGSANIRKKSEDLAVQAVLSNIRPAKLNLLPQYPNSSFEGKIDAQINGFNLKNATASLTFADLRFVTEKATYFEPLATLTFSAPDSLLNFKTTDFTAFSEADTSHIRLNLDYNSGKTALNLAGNNNTANLTFNAELLAMVDILKTNKNSVNGVNIALENGSIRLNDTDLTVDPAQIAISDKRYEIRNFNIHHAFTEFLNLDGVISENNNDSLLMSISRFQAGTLLAAMKYNIPLTGRISGDVVFSRMLTSPRIITRNLHIDDILFDNKQIGNLSVTSGWSSERAGLRFRASLINPENLESYITGTYRPERDSIAMTGNIAGLKLSWFSDYLASSVSGLEGEFGAKFEASGKISKPEISGIAFLNNAKATINKLGVTYLVNDSVTIKSDKISFNNFTICDEKNRKGIVNGSIAHNMFANFNPVLTADFSNFLVLNNAHQTDSLFFGTLQINGKLNITKQAKNWIIDGNLSNGRSNSVMVNVPETPVEARRYKWISFGKEEDEEEHSATVVTAKKQDSEQDFSLPMKIRLNLSIDPNLSAGIILNPSTEDAAKVTGRGNIVYNYDLNNGSQNILGNYTVEDGKCTMTLKNITKKTFTVQNGGILTFTGDPMKTTFNLTAIYGLRANPATLDQSFAEITGSNKIPVNCLLTASGTIDRMKLDYNINLPNESDEIQRKLDGLLYSDDIKIKEMAYLLAFGFFAPVDSQTGSTSNNSSIWASLASSSVTTQLNNLLSGVLSDNWTIGTDLHTDDSNFSGVDMDVNISTRLFNDRLTVNSTLGYHDSAVQTSDGNNNFTGDFDLEYKIFPSGNLLLRFFNLTNNQYYEKARTTQGVGVVYKRQGKT
ncbi:MAG: translocation/assembly module TamB, partial [Dysgonamonadaceae bacterium]|nr:translocation/assembly module TamB [Dysgonamonadaceae bacterium]